MGFVSTRRKGLKTASLFVRLAELAIAMIGNRQQARLSFLSASVMGAALLCGSIAHAQAPKDLPPDVAAELAKAPKPALPNPVVGVDINRFIGNPLLSPVHMTEDAIFQRSILRRGDPYHPGDTGAVLEYWNDLSLGTLLGNARTSLVQTADEQFWYVESGKGRLDDDHEYWDLQEGVAVLIPPNARHRVENITDEPIQLLMLTWSPAGKTPGGSIRVRDVHSLSFLPQGAHWNYFGTYLFAPEDGIDPNEELAIVYMPPMTIAEPHAHIPHWAEVWTKLPPYGSYLMLGSEVREMPPNTAFLSPPNSQTTHSVVNLMKDKTQAWIYIGHWVWKQGPHPDLPLVEPKPLTDSR
jgi:mannose-6-phosphate isomerase-like protein (cupin superfamily)